MPFQFKLFNVKKRSNETRHEIFSKFSVKTPKCHSGDLNVNFEHFSLEYFFVNLEQLVVCLESSKKEQNKQATFLEEAFVQIISLNFMFFMKTMIVYHPGPL